ncbi:hypothetical protein LCGC14_0852960 [marine sediment metagenome]|uniref:Uncharacterized protein n=1 Tax=marine sediment metagenome TaxID=412755 RepID=A0A0F9RU86_9ZZZZ
MVEGYLDGVQLRKLHMGITVPRAAELIAITGTPGLPIYNIIGGVILVTGLFGVCTTTHGGVANTMSFEHDPAAATGADNVITATTDLGTASVVGDIAVVVGAPGTGPLGGHVTVQVLGSTAGKGILMAAGIIGLVATAANGGWRWVISYVPMDDGAYITVA